MVFLSGYHLLQKVHPWSGCGLVAWLDSLILTRVAGRVPVRLWFSTRISCHPNSRYPGLLISYGLDYSIRAFFKLTRACLTCRSKFALGLACMPAASYTPPYESANIHMSREVMKSADIPKWTIRNSDENLDSTSAPQCTLLSPPHLIPT